MSTIKDVAKLAEVSIGTVSNYLTGSRAVNPDKQKRIKSAIEELDYKPNSYAKNLRTNNINEIGLVLPNAYERYYSYLLSGIGSHFSKANYYVNLAFTNDNPDIEIDVINRLLEKKIAGLVVMSCLRDTTFYDSLSSVPVVFIDRIVTTKEANFVSFNQYESMAFLLQQLVNNELNNIMLVAGPEHFSCEQQYAKAYRDFFTSEGISFKESQINHINMTKEEAFRTGISLFQKNPPQAIISTSGLMTSGLEQAARLAGISLDNDMVLISIGQETISNSKKGNNIIATKRPANYLGLTAAKLLKNNIDSPLMFEKQQIILSDKIIKDNLFDTPEAPSFKTSTPAQKLRVLMLDSPNANAINMTRSDFARRTGHDIEVVSCEHGQLLDKLLDIDYINSFDVCMYDNPWLDILVSNDCLLDVSDYMNGDFIDGSLFLDGLIEKVGCVDDRYYGIPFTYGPQLLLYRRDLFENPVLQEKFDKRFGAKLHVPRNWFEFNVVCSFFTKALNLDSPTPYGTTLSARNDANLLPELMPRVWSYGGCVFDSDSQPSVTSPAFKKGVNSFVQTFDYTPKETIHYSVEDTVRDFYLGKSSMLVGYASFISDVNNTAKSKITEKIGYTNIPGNHSVLGSWGLGLPKGCKNPLASMDFIKWTCDPEMSRYFTLLDGQSPLKSVYTNDELANHYPWLPLIHQTYSGNMQRKSIRLPSNTLIPITKIEVLIYHHVMSIVLENTTVDDAMQQLNDELLNLLAEAK